MKRKERLAFVLLLCSFFAFAGCGNYGKLRLESGPGDTMTIQQLEKNWEQYDIFVMGQPNLPAAIIFDRKDDARVIVGERWWALRDHKTLSETISKIKLQPVVGSYDLRLWKMLGPDDHLYGYMFTSWDSAVMQIVDGKTMKVQDLHMPPFLVISATQE